eukprot:2641586-Amphidinium_carterae.1
MAVCTVVNTGCPSYCYSTHPSPRLKQDILFLMGLPFWAWLTEACELAGHACWLRTYGLAVQLSHGSKSGRAVATAVIDWQGILPSAAAQCSSFKVCAK